MKRDMRIDRLFMHFSYEEQELWSTSFVYIGQAFTLPQRKCANNYFAFVSLSPSLSLLVSQRSACGRSSSRSSSPCLRAVFGISSERKSDVESHFAATRAMMIRIEQCKSHLLGGILPRLIGNNEVAGEAQTHSRTHSQLQTHFSSLSHLSAIIHSVCGRK